MAIKMKKGTNTLGDNQVQPTTREVQPAIPEPTYNIIAVRENLNRDLVGSAEVDKLTTQIDVEKPDTIVTFGASAATEIAKTSDAVLNNVGMDELNKSSKMLNALAKIMEQFDLDEIKEEPKGLSKWFGNAKKSLQKILEKYNTLGDEVEKIYVELSKYEVEIKKSNQALTKMFNTNVNTYHELVKYILAGEQGCKEIEEYIAQREQDFQTTGDSSINFELQNLRQALSMLEQRTQDLRTAESVAIQSIPMIKAMEYSNFNLVRKINSAFIITLPVFKQALAQAVMLKRQKVQAETLSAMDEVTNNLLLKNAQMVVEQTKATARMASGSSIKADTLEQTWRTIMNGIEEVRQIETDAKQQRLSDKASLERIKDDMLRTISIK